MVGGAFPLTQHALAAKSSTHSSVKALINVGEKNFDEEYIIGDMYSLLLQKAGFRTQVHVLGSEAGPFQTAMLHGQLDLYPEYTGTGLISVLGLPGIANQTQA